ncbi:UPF0175 family protein [Ectothiorhodospiraceae bacterium BW-2]|nr:UPF0175 family protein [Ectothiorhodospiraceae bacterium BW-2]
MKYVAEIDCPPEILLGLHVDVSQFAEMIRFKAAIALFKEGQLSSGMAARWCKISRVQFLMRAMDSGGAELLENSEDDFLREIGLL